MTPDGTRFRGPLPRSALGLVVWLAGLLAAPPPRPALACGALAWRTATRAAAR